MSDREQLPQQHTEGLSEMLAGKSITIYQNILGGILFFLIGIALLVVMPSQVAVAEQDVVNGRVFPRILVILMMLCGAALIGRDLLKIAKKQPVESITLNLLVEIKAMLIFAILLLSYLLCEFSGLFIVGACFCSVAFLVYFRCRKWNYYAITLTVAVLVWTGFRFLLDVEF